MKRVVLTVLFAIHATMLWGKGYVFFLHNMFLEQAPVSEWHPEYGQCEYDAIISRFRSQGFTVISEIRPANTDGIAYADKVKLQIDSLLAKGIKPSEITVIGTSKGGYIAEYVSHKLKNRNVNFVFIGCCDDDLSANPDVRYHGNILSIYEESDKWHSCRQMKERSGKSVTRFRELTLTTGLKHGFLYKVLDKWMLPAIEWAKGNYDFENVRSLSSVLDSVIKSDTKEPFNGIVLFVENGATRYATCHGYTKREGKTLLKLNDQFYIGSISKQIAAVVLLREYDKGRMDLNKTVRYYLPELSYTWTDSVTIHQLLTHTHGLEDWDRAAPLKFRPGTQFSYSQYGFGLLAMIAEKVSGRSFAMLSDSLFRLCNMPNSMHSPAGNDSSIVGGYAQGPDGNWTLMKTEEIEPLPVAAGRYVSTANDLLRWNNALHGGKLLKPETYKLMMTQQPSAIRQHHLFGRTKYGYGTTVDSNGIVQIGQTGMIKGFNSMYFYYPEQDACLIILSNVQYTPDNLTNSFNKHMAIWKAVRSELKK